MLKKCKRFLAACLTCMPMITVLGTTVKATESIDVTEIKEETKDATFHLKMNVADGFEDEMQCLLVSVDGEREYEFSLSPDNDYTASLSLAGNTTYDLNYYYKSYEEYEIEELQEQYKCESNTPWNLEYNIIKRETPVTKELVPLNGDMTEDEVKKESFKSDIYPNMTEDEVVQSYYDEIHAIADKEENKENITSLASGVKTAFTKEAFCESSGTDSEWDNLTDAQVLAFYYASVKPNATMANNNYDYDEYIKGLDIFKELCENRELNSVYDSTVKIWKYIWEYQRKEKKSPNFATSLLTDFRAENNIEKYSDGKQKEISAGNEIENGVVKEPNAVLVFVKEHITSLIFLLLGCGILGGFYYKKKQNEKGKTIR